eukprot:UN10988
MESLKSTVVSDIQTRMDEYATEAAAQADAMDVYSLISTEQDAQEENMDEKKKQSNADEKIIVTLCDNLHDLTEPKAKASMIWIIGEYAENNGRK